LGGTLALSMSLQRLLVSSKPTLGRIRVVIT